ncbi:MAG: CDP-glycerol glycerophosphotransferase family protein [Dokdonella sp.]|uniref:CDP-glycerol glycerophosphotransferase family protein n=1 Tax=Dokdonella sp. TaxID=2291710 RepID=UPI002B78BDB2|nr:CDP-glycerol glycerophosphotransferase family protein [Xanthomonadales bacterium]HQW76016.1 CDP-glycerol glycerophosphotransferase family protein [Dokdonella sp.]HQX65016.1 CDP-glycerol glycerophosphotransferase family protein [Dokdonella sp.]
MKRYLLIAANLYALPILRPLARAIAASGGEAAWFVGAPLAAYMEADEHVLRDRAQVAAFAPRAVFSAGNWVPHFFPGIKVQVFHGFSVDKRPPDRGHFRIRGWFDLYCTQGPSTTEPFQQLARRHGHFAVVETGWPKLDPLFAANGKLQELPAANGRKVCMYAATFTHGLSSANALYAQIARQVASGERYWLLTLHPKADEDVRERYRALSGANAQFFEAHQLTRMMSAADLLVSDTSSVVAEFLVQGKPVVTFRNRSPKPCMIDIGDPQMLEAALRQALDAPASLLGEIRDFAARTHPSRNGQASERVLEAAEDLICGRLGTLAPKPRNLLRKLQGRLLYRRWLSQFMRA